METKLVDLESHVGESVGVSDWLVISQELVDQFSEVAHDPSWIHNDPERASEGPYGGPVAQGLLTMTLIPFFVWQTYKVTDSAIDINYGFNRCRFPAVVRVGARIRAAVTIQAVENVGDKAVRTVLAVTVEAEDVERPVCVAELVLQHGR